MKGLEAPRTAAGVSDDMRCVPGLLVCPCRSRAGGHPGRSLGGSLFSHRGQKTPTGRAFGGRRVAVLWDRWVVPLRGFAPRKGSCMRHDGATSGNTYPLLPDIRRGDGLCGTEDFSLEAAFTSSIIMRVLSDGRVVGSGRGSGLPHAKE